METLANQRNNSELARKKALEALEEARSKSYQQTLGDSDYLFVQECCRAVLVVSFGDKIQAERIVQIVRVCVEQMLTPLYGAPPLVGELLAPEEVLHRMYNHALELSAGGTANEFPATPTVSRMALSDQQTLTLAFADGITEHQYQVALAVARAADQADEFLVATQYMTYLQQEGRGDFGAVANILLMPQDRVEALIMRFIRRIPREPGE